jgi:hypothetical protein
MAPNAGRGADCFQRPLVPRVRFQQQLTPGVHLPRLRYVKATPYTDETVADTYHWMVRWGLISSAACTADLVENRLRAAATALAAD